MRHKDTARIDTDALRKLAGDRAFARGAEYFRGGQVQILLIEPTRVLAQVSGSEDYRTELTGRGQMLDGHCSCRAFEDWGFCKHMVAVGLAANATGDGEDAGALSRIRDHLKTKSAEALADMIVKMAERDAQLFRRLELDAAASQADDATLEARLRRALEAAVRTGAYVDYASTPDWAAGVDEVLDVIESIAAGNHAAVALKLARLAIDRIEKAIADIDDSEGHGGALLHRAAEIHLVAAEMAQPDPLQFARDLFVLEMEDGYDAFYGSVARYAEVLGERGLTEYRRLADAAWRKSSARSKNSEEFANGDRLANILDLFAEQDGDLDARIALRRRDLSSPYRYLTLAQFCLEHHRRDEAIKYAVEGLWTFEDGRQDERLVLFAADLLTKTERPADAETYLWRAFEKAPSLELYTRLRKTGGAAARQRALQSLERLCTERAGKGWQSPADLLVEVHLQDRAFDEAWAALRRFGASIGLKERIAKATEKTHTMEALEVYEEGVEYLARSAAYAEAVKLIARMAKLRGGPEQATYLAKVRERHGKKRNFMKLLE